MYLGDCEKQTITSRNY